MCHSISCAKQCTCGIASKNEFLARMAWIAPATGPARSAVELHGKVRHEPALITRENPFRISRRRAWPLRDPLARQTTTHAAGSGSPLRSPRWPNGMLRDFVACPLPNSDGVRNRKRGRRRCSSSIAASTGTSAPRGSTTTASPQSRSASRQVVVPLASARGRRKYMVHQFKSADPRRSEVASRSDSDAAGSRG